MVLPPEIWACVFTHLSFPERVATAAALPEIPLRLCGDGLRDERRALLQRMMDTHNMSHTLGALGFCTRDDVLALRVVQWAAADKYWALIGWVDQHLAEPRGERKLSDRVPRRVSAVDFLHYIMHHFELTVDDVRAEDNAALRSAAWYGNLDMVVYLVEGVGLTAADVRAGNDDAARAATANGFADVAAYLRAVAAPARNAAPE